MTPLTINDTDISTVADDGPVCTIGGNCGRPTVAHVIGWVTVGDCPERDVRSTRSVCDSSVCTQIARMQVRNADVVKLAA
jgi:hypothetical protein